jgi:hypothetical protein
MSEKHKFGDEFSPRTETGVGFSKRTPRSEKDQASAASEFLLCATFAVAPCCVLSFRRSSTLCLDACQHALILTRRIQSQVLASRSRPAEPEGAAAAGCEPAGARCRESYMLTRSCVDCRVSPKEGRRAPTMAHLPSPLPVAVLLGEPSPRTAAPSSCHSQPSLTLTDVTASPISTAKLSHSQSPLSGGRQGSGSDGVRSVGLESSSPVRTIGLESSFGGTSSGDPTATRSTALDSAGSRASNVTDTVRSSALDTRSSTLEIAGLRSSAFDTRSSVLESAGTRSSGLDASKSSAAEASRSSAVASGSVRLNSGEAAAKPLDQCRNDMEDQHLEIEGVIGGGGYGTVYCGTWRGLEVAIKTVVFEVWLRNCNRAHLAVFCTACPAPGPRCLSVFGDAGDRGGGNRHAAPSSGRGGDRIQLESRERRQHVVTRNEED